MAPRPCKHCIKTGANDCDIKEGGCYNYGRPRAEDPTPPLVKSDKQDPVFSTKPGARPQPSAPALNPHGQPPPPSQSFATYPSAYGQGPPAQPNFPAYYTYGQPPSYQPYNVAPNPYGPASGYQAPGLAYEPVPPRRALAALAPKPPKPQCHAQLDSALNNPTLANPTPANPHQNTPAHQGPVRLDPAELDQMSRDIQRSESYIDQKRKYDRGRRQRQNANQQAGLAGQPAGNPLPTTQVQQQQTYQPAPQQVPGMGMFGATPQYAQASSQGPEQSNFAGQGSSRDDRPIGLYPGPQQQTSSYAAGSQSGQYGYDQSGDNSGGLDENEADWDDLIDFSGGDARTQTNRSRLQEPKLSRKNMKSRKDAHTAYKEAKDDSAQASSASQSTSVEDVTAGLKSTSLLDKAKVASGKGKNKGNGNKKGDKKKLGDRPYSSKEEP